MLNKRIIPKISPLARKEARIVGSWEEQPISTVQLEKLDRGLATCENPRFKCRASGPYIRRPFAGLGSKFEHPMGWQFDALDFCSVKLVVRQLEFDSFASFSCLHHLDRCIGTPGVKT